MASFKVLSGPLATARRIADAHSVEKNARPAHSRIPLPSPPLEDSDLETEALDTDAELLVEPVSPHNIDDDSRFPNMSVFIRGIMRSCWTISAVCPSQKGTATERP